MKPAPQAFDGGDMFANRLRRNLRTIGRWARRTGVACYRLYDADIPEYALAVDLYRGEALWVHCQAYAPPRSVDEARARTRLEQAFAVLPQVLEVDPAHIFVKLRQRQRGGSQYGKLARRGVFHQVPEGRCRFWVNFTDYLDTGLFLDHRITREMTGEMAKGGRFLNLFAYTGTASVHAALSGALSTTTVDLSSRYLDWARRNMALNGCTGEAHRFVQADCLQWLESQGRSREPPYDVIFLDPPTLSRSKRMQRSFDVQRDHPSLVTNACRLLAPGGVLVFSNNFRRFRMAPEVQAGFLLEEITARTIPEDFRRNPRIHNCWLIRNRA